MKKILLPHTAIDDVIITSIVNIIGKKLTLTFTVKGSLKNYIFTKEQLIQRANELWKATCFELFLADSKNEGYYELNLSPSLAWNFYYLKHYRADEEEVLLASEPTIQIVEDTNFYSIEFTLENFNFEIFDSCNLTAILLTKKDKRTFWSLKEMADTPDFHNRDYFINL